MLWYRCDVLLALCICPLPCLTVSPCPPGCCCPRQGFLVLCESLGLRSLPRLVPLSTSVLSVARNQLCNVDHLLGPFSGLQELSLSHNLLARFPRGLPPSLESLLLQENRITYITSGALRKLRNLTRLVLEDNRIRAIAPGALLGLSRLQTLTLKGNRLSSLPLDLPPSLTHLDLSQNCISSLELPSLSALINLQILQVNGNCLRSVPENTFDSLPRLRSVGLADNLWVCQCDILYLYRWLLSGRLKMATDLVCREPGHLAHRLLLDLSVASICPGLLKPNSRSGPPPPTADTSAASEAHSLPRTRLSPYSLETLTHEECAFLNASQSDNSAAPTTTSAPKDGQSCGDDETAPSARSDVTSAGATPPWQPTDSDEELPRLSSQPFPHRDSAAIVALLAVLCVLLALTLTGVLVLLKKVLVRQQRVAPANERAAASQR